MDCAGKWPEDCNVSQARRKAWKWIIESRESLPAGARSFSAQQMAAATGLNLHTAKRFLSFLLEKRRLKVWRYGRGPLPTLYYLLDATPLVFDQPGARAGYRVRTSRKPNTARQRIWNSCRILRTFTLNEVSATAQTAYVTCSAYIKRLERAGLVRKIKRHAAQDGEFAIFRLNVDAGHPHPVVRNDGVFCPARNTLYPYKEAEHE
ncbi:hypothetical protein [Marinobacterium rhizophilum]|uniref:Uncharacterized protein n=1 Tax=Marinobacterium rhizophilum TaxID=420402 RepID=A0ABY5HPZ4_9GAMM|nr:hypothetical protein [Marinobacterium rhizophilum]UTW14506.1 hypothetical protein KDW95_04595 [Marinobacterium rhizophilum]